MNKSQQILNEFFNEELDTYKNLSTSLLAGSVLVSSRVDGIVKLRFNSQESYAFGEYDYKEFEGRNHFFWGRHCGKKMRIIFLAGLKEFNISLLRY